MARTLPEPWTPEQVKRVESLLKSFQNEPEDVCACLDCKKADLNYLCRQAFGLTFAQAVAKYGRQGKCEYWEAVRRAAIAEKPHNESLKTYGQQYIGVLGTVERRRQVAKEVKQAEESTDF